MSPRLLSVVSIGSHNQLVHAVSPAGGAKVRNAPLRSRGAQLRGNAAERTCKGVKIANVARNNNFFANAIVFSITSDETLSAFQEIP